MSLGIYRLVGIWNVYLALYIMPVSIAFVALFLRKKQFQFALSPLLFWANFFFIVFIASWPFKSQYGHSDMVVPSGLVFSLQATEAVLSILGLSYIAFNIYLLYLAIKNKNAPSTKLLISYCTIVLVFMLGLSLAIYGMKRQDSVTATEFLQEASKQIASSSITEPWLLSKLTKDLGYKSEKHSYNRRVDISDCKIYPITRNGWMIATHEQRVFIPGSIQCFLVLRKGSIITSVPEKILANDAVVFFLPDAVTFVLPGWPCYFVMDRQNDRYPDALVEAAPDMTYLGNGQFKKK